MRVRITELRDTIKTQRVQIQDLFRENDRLQETKDEHRELTETFDRLDHYTKRMTEKNKQVQTFW